MQRLAHELGDPRRIVDPDGPPARRREEPPVFDLLERLAVGVSALDLADEHHRGRRVLGRGGMQPRRGVAGAGAPRDHDRPGPSGELAAGLRHVRGAALVPAGDGGDRVARVVEGVEGREAALARHAEDGVDAVDPQCVDQDPAAGAPIALLHVRHRRAWIAGARIFAWNARGRMHQKTRHVDVETALCREGPRPGQGRIRDRHRTSGAPARQGKSLVDMKCRFRAARPAGSATDDPSGAPILSTSAFLEGEIGPKRAWSSPFNARKSRMRLPWVPRSGQGRIRDRHRTSGAPARASDASLRGRWRTGALVRHAGWQGESGAGRPGPGRPCGAVEVARALGLDAIGAIADRWAVSHRAVVPAPEFSFHQGE